MQRCELSWKKWCALRFSTGVAPDSTEAGCFNSVGEYTAPQTSQLSPYWSFAPHFGHSPFTKRSGRNMPFTGSKSCSIVRSAIRPCLRSAR